MNLTGHQSQGIMGHEVEAKGKARPSGNRVCWLHNNTRGCPGVVGGLLALMLMFSILLVNGGFYIDLRVHDSCDH